LLLKTIAFAEKVGKFYFPSVQQNIFPGLLFLLGALCLISTPLQKIGEQNEEMLARALDASVDEFMK
jgi:hypothetical protein